MAGGSAAGLWRCQWAEKSAMSVRLQGDDFRWAEQSNYYEVTRR
jgi:hypothetical protein